VTLFRHYLRCEYKARHLQLRREQQNGSAVLLVSLFSFAFVSVVC